MPSLSEEVRGRAKERELSLVREVLSGLIGCASAALCLRAVEGREIQTGDISFARACTVAYPFITISYSLSDFRAADLLAVVRLRDEPAGLPAVPGPPEEPRPRARRLPPRGRQRQEDLRVQVLQRRTGECGEVA